MVDNVQRETTNVHYKFSSNNIAIFIGKSGIGKSAIFIRVYRYLRDSGHYIEINHKFRDDSAYTALIEDFNIAIDDPDYAPKPSKSSDSILIDVMDVDGSIKYQLLDTAGSDFFNKNLSNQIGSTRYLDALLTDQNKRILYVIPFDNEVLQASKKGFTGNEDKFLNNYFPNIQNNLIARNIDKIKDSILFVQTKIDIDYGKNGVPNNEEHFKMLRRNYPKFGRMITEVENREIDYSFMTFSAGLFRDFKDQSSRKIWTPSKVNYPKEMWIEIKRSFAKKFQLPWPFSVIRKFIYKY